MEAGISLGSNLGDRLSNLQDARNRLSATAGVTVIDASCIYETAPIDVPEKYGDLPFLNGVIILDISMQPLELLASLHGIEEDMGRIRAGEQNAPRPIDLDIIYIDNLRMDNPSLMIPHPRCTERLFVLRPLADVRPDLVLPQKEKSIGQLVNGFSDANEVSLFAESW